MSVAAHGAQQRRVAVGLFIVGLVMVVGSCAVKHVTGGGEHQPLIRPDAYRAN